jgi:TonB family protein
MLMAALAWSVIQVCLADVAESPNGDGTYRVVSPTTRSRAEVMKSFAGWANSMAGAPPTGSMPSWSADNGVLSVQEPGEGRSSRIKLNDLDTHSLLVTKTTYWEIHASSISGYGRGFEGRLHTADDVSQSLALQALQDIYDLALLAQRIAVAQAPCELGKLGQCITRVSVENVAVRSGVAPARVGLAAQVPAADSQPPFGKKVPSILPLPTTPSFDDACPYPAAARARGETGTVLLLVHVATDGSALDTALEKSSGSSSLDEATAACVKTSGRFAIRRNGAKAVSYWGRMKFNWGFGD